MVDRVDQSIGTLDLLSEEEKDLVLNRFNDTAAEYPREKTVVDLFEDQAAKHPDRIAIVFKDTEMSYGELNAKANQVARKLRALGVGRDDMVAILAERGMEMIVGIYGVLKSGGAYVPIDPTYPEDRIRFMLEDSGAKAVLFAGAEIETELPVLDLLDKEVYSGETENLEKVNKPTDLVYCIYTSGTTGKPKGVLIEHSSLNNYLHYAKRNYFADEVQGALFTNYTFDLTITTIFGVIIFGGKLTIYADDMSDALRYVFAEESSVNFVKLTPAQLHITISESGRKNQHIHSFVLGGEELRTDLCCETIQACGSDVMIHNEYGPTETTIGCCDHVFVMSEAGNLTVSIGRPIANTKIYIMDDHNLCGIGMPGELCIAGDGVARGYLNRPELTAEKFIDNPYQREKSYLFLPL